MGSHSFTNWGGNITGAFQISTYRGEMGGNGIGNYDILFNASRVVPTTSGNSAENQVKNIALLPFIYYI